MSRYDRIVNGGVLVVLALNALWVLVIPSFPTVDGWPHLHTARMLMDGTLGDVYCPNEGMVPNRMGHWVLGVLQLVLPALAAERVMLALLIGLMGFGTWALARAIGGATPLILLVLPFTWNFLLVMGFHNFLLGIGLALVGAAFWIRSGRRSWWHVLGLFLWSLLLLQTHSTGLMFFLLITGTHELVALNGADQRTRITLVGKQLPVWVAFVLACLPATILLLRFHLDQGAQWSGLAPAQAIHDLKELRTLLLYDGWDEGKFAYAMKLVLIAGLGAVMVVRTQGGRVLRPSFAKRDVLLLLAVLIFAVHPFIPDSTGAASYITVRLQLMGLLLFITWLGSGPMPLSASFVPVILLLLVHQARLRYISDTMNPLAEQRDLVMQAAQQLPEGAVVLPVSFEEQWVLGHLTSLLAVDRKVTLLENYECSNDYFPLRWCPSLPERLIMHLGGQDRCLGWLPEHTSSGAWPVIDHIVVLGMDTAGTRCGSPILERILAEEYVESYGNGYARIHTRQLSP